MIFNAILDLGSIQEDTDIEAYIHDLLNQIPKNFPLPDLVPDWPSLSPLLNAIFPGIGLKDNQLTLHMPDQSRAEALQLLLIRFVKGDYPIIDSFSYLFYSLLQTAVAPGSVIILDDAQHFDSSSWTLTLAAAQQLKGPIL